jgi:hypothetical protein
LSGAVDAPSMPHLRAPSPRRFAAGALASFAAVFGVLALRVHDGDDPGLKATASSPTSATTASDTSSATSSDSTSSDSASGLSSTPSASTSAS